MRTRIYDDFGGWFIRAGNETIYDPPRDMEFDAYPTLQRFENMARKAPGRDWQAILMLPLRGATYQRQGRNLWVLVESNRGFA